METQHEINYYRIAEAIEFIQANFRQQPSLDEIAEKLHLSPFHFQRLFVEWAGTSPKKFLQYITIEHAKKILTQPQASLFDTAHATGLSGTGRLHDLFIQLEGMTPAEYKNGGKNLEIQFSLEQSPFGQVIVASTPKGICYMAFEENPSKAIQSLESLFPNASLKEEKTILQQQALSFFKNEENNLPRLKLHLKGTEFQINVWKTLLSIPMGQLSTYGNIAATIGNPNASRAVGTAIGSNPIAFLIPCHRVIQSSGNLAGYRWGTTRKTAIIGWESAKTNPMADFKTLENESTLHPK